MYYPHHYFQNKLSVTAVFISKVAAIFFTLIAEKRRRIFADDDNVKRLRAAFKTIMQKRPFLIDAAVVLPDHLHFI